MKKPVLVLAITAFATFVMGWVAHRIYKNSQTAELPSTQPAPVKHNQEVKPVSADSSSSGKDSSLYQQTNFQGASRSDSLPPKEAPDTKTTRPEENAEIKIKFIPVKTFRDFAVSERYSKAFSKKLDFSTCSSGQLYKKETRQAAEKGVSFGGRYAFAVISCDSNCFSSTLTDLKTGKVYAGPHATTGYRFRPDSKLLLVNPPDANGFYSSCDECIPELYVWTGKLFKKIQ